MHPLWPYVSEKKLWFWESLLRVPVLSNLITHASVQMPDCFGIAKETLVGFLVLFVSPIKSS